MEELPPEKNIRLWIRAHFSSIALVAGFVFDYFTLWRIDLIEEELIFILYILAAAFCIWSLSRPPAQAGEWRGRWYNLSLFALQFCFGGLLGRFFIFYSMSGSFGASWPFLILLAALFVLNERAHSRYELFLLRTSIYFVVLFSFLIFFVPILVGSLSVFVFLLSGLSALLFMYAFARLLFRRFPSLVPERGKLLASVLAIFCVINMLYFANIIPPIPLALKTSGIYHNVQRVTTKTGVQYQVRDEAAATGWFANLWPLSPQIHVSEQDSIYFFSAVFAPTRIRTSIVHCWQYENPETGEWVTKQCVDFPIVGGSDGGYRGYSIRHNPEAGLWRVRVETSRGAVIGSENFVVVRASTTPQLVEKIL